MANFKYLNKNQDVFDAEEATDVQASQKQLSAQLHYYEQQLADLVDTDIKQKIEVLLQIGRIQIERNQGADAWQQTFLAFKLAKENTLWELAVLACDVLFLTEEPKALVALGHALWLSITFPIDPELSVAVLEHLVAESPAESDTKVVAATTAHYIAEIRTGKDSDLSLFTNQLLALSAKEHSHIDDQLSFDLWRKTMQLDNPDVFLAKLSAAIEQLVSGEWWINKAAIYQKIDEQTQN